MAKNYNAKYWKIFNIDNNNKAQKLNNVTIKSVTKVKQKRITNLKKKFEKFFVISS